MLFNVISSGEKLSALLKLLLTGILPTVRIFGFTLLFSLPLGMLLAAARSSKMKLLRAPVSLFVYLMRSTPLMLQLLFCYFLFSRLTWTPFLNLLFGNKRTDFPVRCIIFMFSLNYSAYFAEIFRSGIAAVPQGQREAAKVLGLTKTQTFFRIQLPQVFKHVMPSLTNEFVTLVKDTSISKVISVSLQNRTLLHIAESQVTTLASLDPYLLALLFFLLFNGIIEQSCRFIEHKLNYYQ